MPFPEFLAGLGTTESDKSVLRGRGEVLAIGTEHYTIDGALVAQRGKCAIGQPLEVVPFPAAQFLRALPEQFFHATQVVRRPLAFRKCDALKVRIASLALQHLALTAEERFEFGLCLGLMAECVGNPHVADGQHARRYTHHQGDSRYHPQHGLSPPSEFAEPVPCGWRTRLDWLVLQIPLHVACQSGRRLVPA